MYAVIITVKKSTNSIAVFGSIQAFANPLVLYFILLAGLTWPTCSLTCIAPFVGLAHQRLLYPSPSAPSDCMSFFSIPLIAPFFFSPKSSSLFPPHTPAANNWEGAPCSFATANPWTYLIWPLLLFMGVEGGSG